MVKSVGTNRLHTLVNLNAVVLQNRRLRSFTEAFNHFLERCDIDEATTGAGAGILRLSLPDGVTPLKDCKDLLSNAIRVEEDYEKGTLQGTFVDCVDKLIFYSLHRYWSVRYPLHPTDLTNIIPCLVFSWRYGLDKVREAIR